MALTNKYSFETLEWTTTGWNGPLSANSEKFDLYCQTIIPVTCGETISKYDSVCIRGDAKAYKARANGTLQPCIGLALEDGIADGEIRVQRAGPITNSGWSWTPGQPVYLDPSTAGDLTQSWPTANDQIIGVAQSATTIILEIFYDVGNTTQTVTSTTSTSSTTICTTTTHTTTSTSSTTTSSSSTTTTVP